MPRRPLMVRVALLPRSCNGVAAATELRRPAPSRSFCASRLDATRRMRPAFISPRVDLNFNSRGSWPTVLGHPPPPWPRNEFKYASPPQAIFFIVARKMTPRSRKSGYELLLGVGLQTRRHAAPRKVLFASINICRANTDY